MEISHYTHPHTLVLKNANYPYYCWGCNQLGFGLSYICSKGCNYFLHKQCGKPQTLIEYPFSNDCILRFQERRPGVDSPCDACGNKITRFHYRCTCIFQKRHLHPSCLADEKSLDGGDGLMLHLEKAAASECLHCGSKDLSSMVHGWAYVSSCGSYCYHVSCVKEIIHTQWKHGVFNLKSDSFPTIKQLFADDMNRINQLVVARKERLIRNKLNLLVNMMLTGHYVGAFSDAFLNFLRED